MQFGDGTKLPTKYAFGMVENRHDNILLVTVRMQLSGEVKQLDAGEVEPCTRLLNMRSLVSKEDQNLHILKV